MPFIVRSVLNRLYQNRLLSSSSINLSVKSLEEKFVTVTQEKKPFTMKIETPEFKSLFTKAFIQLADIFKTNSYEIRIAGGAVRDLLSGYKPKDVDFATTATPDEMKAMFTDNNIKMINNKGEKHGTITARIDQENFEVTTLRIDMETDGRHATVRFTKDWHLDANRRDLTINSMFLGLDGTLYDYFDGHNDLIHRRVIFVGDPYKRIQEDYLRILRYFRFYGRIAEEPNKHDPQTLEVIKENIQGLNKISGERLWLELQKIVVGNFARHILLIMYEVKMFPLLGLPAEPDLKEFERVVERSKRFKEINPVVRISALMKTEAEVLKFHERCKLSGFERDLALFIVANRHAIFKSAMDYKKLILYSKSKSAKDWVIELLKYMGESVIISELQSWQMPMFPLSGRLLLNVGVPGGRKLGIVIDALKVKWVDSEFRLTSEQLMGILPDVLSDLSIQKVKVERSVSELENEITKIKKTIPKSVLSEAKREMISNQPSANVISGYGDEICGRSDVNSKEVVFSGESTETSTNVVGVSVDATEIHTKSSPLLPTSSNKT